MKVISDLVVFIVFLIAATWVFVRPDFDSSIALALASGVALTLIGVRYQHRDTSILFGLMLSPIMRWVDRRRPIAAISYDTLAGPDAIQHEVRAWAIWNKTGPTGHVELRHRVSGGSWRAFENFEGHHIKFDLKDLDNDGNVELLAQYSCGAHTRMITAFRIGAHGFPELIPGSRIGGDWPEIEVDDRDGDGKFEIYAKQRNWAGNSSQEFLQEVYLYQDGKFVKSDPEQTRN